MTPNTHIHITSSTSPKDGQASYAATIHTGTHALLIAGTVTTSVAPRLELTAVLRALQSLQELHQQGIAPRLTPVVLHPETTAITETLATRRPSLWKANGWKMAQGNPVRDRDLWEQILNVTEDMNISYS